MRWLPKFKPGPGACYIVKGSECREYHIPPRVIGAHLRLVRLFFLLASACMQAKQGSKTFAAPARKERKCQHVP